MKQIAPQNSGGMSWGAMLALLLLVLVLATGIAFWMLYPFFHAHKH